jgi:LysM repeat protein
MLFRTRFICLVIMAAVTTGSAVPHACSRTYVVQEGDTCDSICDSHGVSTYQLKSLNSDIVNQCYSLKIGETLCLGIKGQDCLHTYEIKAGDTCDSIATAFGIDTSTLLANNRIIMDGCSNTYINEVLCVDKVLIGYTKRSTLA